MQAMILAHRIECPTCSIGPYNCTCEPWAEWSKGEKWALRDRHSTDFFLSTRPGMYVDFPREHRDLMERYYSGFRNTCQMLAWFNKDELVCFRDAGFKLALYVTDQWYMGYSKSQLFFLRVDRWRMRDLPVD